MYAVGVFEFASEGRKDLGGDESRPFRRQWRRNQKNFPPEWMSFQTAGKSHCWEEAKRALSLSVVTQHYIQKPLVHSRYFPGNTHLSGETRKHFT